MISVVKKSNFLRLLICLLVLPTAIYAQAPSPKAKKLLSKAKSKNVYEEYDAAIKILKRVVKKYPTYTLAYAKLAETYWKKEDLKAAEKIYKRLLVQSKNDKENFLTYYALGNLMFEQQQYAAAVDYYEQATATNIPEKWNNKMERVKWLLENSRFAQQAMANPVDFDPILLDNNINTRYDEYLPMVTADESSLVFTRRMSSDIHGNEDFYYSKLQSDSTWQIALSLESPINTPLDEGAICISPDGAKLFFAARGRSDSEGGFDIYYCNRVGSSWNGPYNIGRPINSSSWESQPSISADGKALYFCSRRGGGYGGIDIWVSYLNDNGFWSEPENLGPNINTPFDEQSPFIHPDNQTLYFSSNGHIGMGDADLYLSRKQNDKWGEAENLGYPINTLGNENGLIVTASGKKAYFSSFNDSTGLDIYYFDLPPSVQPNYVSYVKGKVRDKESKKALGATIELIDLESGEIIIQTTSDVVNGEFLVTLSSGKNYMYNVSKAGYLFFSENFSLKNYDSEQPYFLNIDLQPIKKEEKGQDDLVWNVGQSVVLKNVFFASNSFELQPNSFSELDKLANLLLEYPKLKIEISGHTDNIGEEDYNQQLSNNRAKAVYNYLVNKGIAAKQLTYKGYGSTRPIATNDTEQGRAINRRTEFTIIDGLSLQMMPYGK